MTGDESRELRIGDRVCWKADPKDQGVITEKNWAGVTIQWINATSRPYFITTWHVSSGCPGQLLWIQDK
jgi:hypothetical protein